MTARNRLLADGVRDDAQLSGFELVMAETGIAVAAARLEAVAPWPPSSTRGASAIPIRPFPGAPCPLEGSMEDDLARMPALEAEDAYARTLRMNRERDRGAGRTLDGPHRSDLIVVHGPKQIAARLCSTGEQKALLIGLVLAHAELLTARQEGAAPILLLDEITAHLDRHRRAALFEEILRLEGPGLDDGHGCFGLRGPHRTGAILGRGRGRGARPLRPRGERQSAATKSLISMHILHREKHSGESDFLAHFQARPCYEFSLRIPVNDRSFMSPQSAKKTPPLRITAKTASKC